MIGVNLMPGCPQQPDDAEPQDLRGALAGLPVTVGGNGYRSPGLDRPGAVEGAGRDAGVAWHYGDPMGEQRALAAGKAIVDLSHLGLVRVTGEDRLTWLNDLTSQKLDILQPGQSTETLVLSPQGRIEHAAAVLADHDAVWLITDAGAAPGLAGWLTSMRFMRRVEVADVTDEYAVIGRFAGENVAETSGDGGVAGGDSGSGDGGIRWTDPWPGVLPGGTRYGAESSGEPWRLTLALTPQAALTQTLDGAALTWTRLAGTWALEALRIAAWRPRFGAEVDDTSLPHELDWLRTAVHLNKGCYRGQETSARTHNVGHPPRRLVMLHLDGSDDVLPAHGSIVHMLDGASEVVEVAGSSETGNGVAVGRVTSAARHHSLGPIALAVIKRTIPDDAPLTVAAEVAGRTMSIAAAQEVIVPSHGESVDRPQPRGPLTRGLRHGDMQNVHRFG
ncbi:MAG: hypothetical protein LBB54_06785, partial [Cellulomonadaceae bacterium]|nr:hypothetical protein [Cellulomonadaceae bacterium]